MPRRIVDALCVDGATRTYKIPFGTAGLRLTDEEYIGIAKQYHVEDGLSLADVTQWSLRRFDPKSRDDADEAE